MQQIKKPWIRFCGIINGGMHRRALAFAFSCLVSLSVSAEGGTSSAGSGGAADNYLNADWSWEEFVTPAASADGTVELTLASPSGLMNFGGVSHRTNLLTVALGTDLQAADFKIADTHEVVLFMSLDVEKDDSNEYLVLVQQPVVKLNKTDVRSKNKIENGVIPPSAFTNATVWSDGKVPHSGAHYYVQGITGFTFIRTPQDDYTFPGLSLVIGNQSLLLLCCDNLTVGTLRIFGGGVLHNEQGVTGTATLKGSELWLQSGRVYLTAYNGCDLRINSDLCGDAEVFLTGQHWASSAPYGSMRFNGETKDFTGRLMMGRFNVANGKPIADEHLGKLTYFYIKNGDFNAPQESFDWRGIELCTANSISMRDGKSVTLSASANRGIYVNGTGRLNTSESGVFTVDWPFTFNGELTKSGNGTLALGGAEARFIDADGNRGSVPVEEKNVFKVTAGQVKVTAVDTLNGVSVRMADGTSLEVVVDAADPTHLRYGLRNARTDNPFVLSGSATELPVKCRLSGVPAEYERRRPFYAGIVTVSAEAAATVRAMLSPDPLVEELKSYKITPEERAEGDTVTFGYLCEPIGFTVIMR